GQFVDPEIDDHQWDQCDRGQGTEEVYQRIAEGADVLIPAEHETRRHRQRYAGDHADEYPPCRHHYVKGQPAAEQLAEALDDRVWGWHQRRIDQGAIMYPVPRREQQKPRSESQGELAQGYLCIRTADEATL